MKNNKWLGLYILCLGVLMIVLDTTIVNVALPSIKGDLQFSEASLAWVVNAYVLTFGGFLLLGARLGDLYGHKKLFLIGLVIFTTASLACGIAPTQFILILARAVQGFGGAIVSSVSLSLILIIFKESGDRAKAMGVYGFVAAAGGSVGSLLGGVLTGTFNWHWIFLVNLPLGVIVFALCLKLIPNEHKPPKIRHLDIIGAVTITSSLLFAVYAIINGSSAGWVSMQTLGLLLASIILLAFFIVIELKAKAPIMPLGIFKKKNIMPANIIGIMWSAGMFSWFFLSALYLQIILKYTPLQVGLAFIPSDVIMAIFSIGLSAKIVMRFGVKAPIIAGMFLVAVGLLLFSFAPENGSFLIHVLPGMIILGLGAGMALNPLLLAAMSGVPDDESGLVSGVVNTAFMMGGALGLAVLVSAAASKTSSILSTGATQSAHYWPAIKWRS